MEAASPPAAPAGLRTRVPRVRSLRVLAALAEAGEAPPPMAAATCLARWEARTWLVLPPLLLVLAPLPLAARTVHVPPAAAPLRAPLRQFALFSPRPGLRPPRAAASAAPQLLQLRRKATWPRLAACASGRRQRAAARREGHPGALCSSAMPSSECSRTHRVLHCAQTRERRRHVTAADATAAAAPCPQRRPLRASCAPLRAACAPCAAAYAPPRRARPFQERR